MANISTIRRAKTAEATAKAVGKAAAKQRMLKQLVCSDAPEQALRFHGFRSIAGVDEVGRGALFGPVVAAAVILPERMGSLARAGPEALRRGRAFRERVHRLPPTGAR